MSEDLAAITTMIVEENLIIAIDIEAKIKALGIDNIVVGGSLDHGTDLVERHRPQLAILDINLGDETSFSLAEQCLIAGVKVIFVSGYGQDIDFPPELGKVVVVKKPFKTHELKQAVVDILTTN